MCKDKKHTWRSLSDEAAKKLIWLRSGSYRAPFRGTRFSSSETWQRKWAAAAAVKPGIQLVGPPCVCGQIAPQKLLWLRSTPPQISPQTPKLAAQPVVAIDETIVWGLLFFSCNRWYILCGKVFCCRRTAHRTSESSKKWNQLIWGFWGGGRGKVHKLQNRVHKKQKSPLLRGACLNPISLGEGLYQQYHLFGLPAILRQSIILPNDIITSPIE